MNKLQQDFFVRDTLTVARSLLGQILCRKIDDKIQKGIIVETEAYTQEEEACHAYKGLTKRSETLFKPPGTFYVYMIYGVYYCSNVVTEQEGYGSAVLLRALEPIENLDNTNGPGKICREMSITTELNGIDITAKHSEVWIEKGIDISDKKIIKTPRIGITKAIDYNWRFYVKDNNWVSKK